MQAIMQATKHLLGEKGRWLFMKGTYPQDELSLVAPTYQVHELNVPGVVAKRHLIIVPYEFEDKVRGS